MGCDIHAYIEYRQQNSTHWNSFGGRINAGRNYLMFNLLAGLRGEGKPLYSLRGMPSDAGYHARYDNQIFICDSGGEGTATPECAARYVKTGSQYVQNAEGKNTWVTNPDWHSHSWLLSNELESVLKAFRDYPDASLRPPMPEYAAILAALKSFEEQGYSARLVFWFDN